MKAGWGCCRSTRLIHLLSNEALHSFTYCDLWLHDVTLTSSFRTIAYSQDLQCLRPAQAGLLDTEANPLASRSGCVISPARRRGRNSKFRFLEVLSRDSQNTRVTSAQRSRSLWKCWQRTDGWTRTRAFRPCVCPSVRPSQSVPCDDKWSQEHTGFSPDSACTYCNFHRTTFVP